MVGFFILAKLTSGVTFAIAVRLTASEIRGGKSGQHRAPYFLTGRGRMRKLPVTESVTETIPSRPGRDKGEKAG